MYSSYTMLPYIAAHYPYLAPYEKLHCQQMAINWDSVLSTGPNTMTLNCCNQVKKLAAQTI